MTTQPTLPNGNPPISWDAFLQSQEGFILEQSAQEYSAFRNLHALAVSCNAAIKATSESRHNVLTSTAYQQLTAGIPGNPVYRYTWADLRTFMSTNRMSCYDGYLGFDFSGSLMTLRRSDIFQNTESLYPAILFEAIEDKIRALAGTVNSIHFTWGTISVLQRGVSNQVRRIVFHVEYTNAAGTPSTLYYDMSDDPT